MLLLSPLSIFVFDTVNIDFMNSFLNQVVTDLNKRFARDLADKIYVFPNRRAGVFFQKYVSQNITMPMFAPEIYTINQLFERVSGMQKADNLSLLFHLYVVYKDIVSTNETFDEFLYWGQMLLGDFDDLDKFNVPVDGVFANVKEMKEIECYYDYLSDNQKEAIATFWDSMSRAKDGNVKSGFLHLFEKLSQVYEAFKKLLMEKGEAYDGLAQRIAIEKLGTGQLCEELQDRQLVFIGFNALSECERKLMKYFRKNANALFYWDYASEYLKDNVAGRFVNENLTDFPQACEIVGGRENRTHFHLIPIPSIIAQAQYVGQCVSELHPSSASSSDMLNTAVVLPDETLLMSVLHALPENMRQVNVTMGYPMSVTSIMGFMEQVFTLRTKERVTKDCTQYYYKTVMFLLRHKYVQTICGEEASRYANQVVQDNMVYVSSSVFSDAKSPLLQALFVNVQNVDAIQYLINILTELLEEVSHNAEEWSMESEFIYQYYAICIRFLDMSSALSLPDMRWDTLHNLLAQMVRSTSVPFRGEPIGGLQVMGMLETRSLDFKNVIIASLNEGILPKKQVANSFIPYNLRLAWGLPTYEYNDAVMAYHFYRLLGRAENVYLIYDARTNREQTDEMSRYILQLRYQYDVQFEQTIVKSEVELPRAVLAEVAKDNQIMQKLMDYCRENGSALSASAINTYLNCSMKFYLNYVCDLKESEEVDENIESNMFGTIYHGIMEELFAQYIGKVVDEKALSQMRTRVDKVLKEIYTKNVFHKDNVDESQLEGRHQLIMGIIGRLVEKQLEQERTQIPFTYLGSEVNLKAAIPVHIMDDFHMVYLKGYVDRMDRIGDEIRIIDYKTGSVDSLLFDSVHDVFDAQLQGKRSKYALQTMLYSWLYVQNSAIESNTVIRPYIYAIRKIFGDTYLQVLNRKADKDEKKLLNYMDIHDEFESCLKDFMENDMFNPKVPFRQTDDKEMCKYCPFAVLCGR